MQVRHVLCVCIHKKKFKTKKMTSNLTKIEWKDRTKETKSHKTDISNVNSGRN